MKIEQLIVQHLYAHKKVTLQGIGSFYLDPAVALPAETDKEADLPAGAIRFEYNLKAGEDEELIRHIVQQTRKIRPLAASDLESYSILARQFINIGKPLNIEGIGTISKNQEGNFEFTQGHFAPPRLEESPRELKEKTEEHISFESEAPKPEGSKKFLLVAAILLILGMTGLAVYYFLFMNKPAPVAVQVQEPTGLQPDSTLLTDSIPTTDSTAALRAAGDSLSTIQKVTNDSSGFRVVIKKYASAANANKQYKNLTLAGHKLTLETLDSTHHRLLMSFQRPLQDTGKVRDSLQRFFGGNPTILIP